MIFRDKENAVDMAELIRRVEHSEVEIRTLRNAMFHFLKGQHKLKDDFDEHVKDHYVNAHDGIFVPRLYPRTITAEDIKDIRHRLYNMFCARTTLWSEF